MSDDDSGDEVNIGEIVSGELYSEEIIEESFEKAEIIRKQYE